MTTMKPGHKGEADKRGFAGPTGSEREWLGPLAAVWSFRWILVAFVLILWFVYYPIVDNFVVSTKNQDIFTGETAFVGLENYRRLQADPVVWTSIVNNTLYAVISVVFQVFGAFVLAALIEGLAGERWRRFWRAVYFVPSAISITVTGLLFYCKIAPNSDPSHRMA
jgi:raffinose/stachyose/melibiose transport system permease protein